MVLGARLKPPSKATSVDNMLLQLNCRKFVVIHDVICLEDRPGVSGGDQCGLVSVIPTKIGGNQHNLIECFLLLLITGSVYKMNFIGQSTEPCGTP